ncbi:hypothetical protein [Marinobacterium lacunae]|uniref:hypothetical protein n=1 Tax=Marinobacterium lacunae TaxID=1232683 RepID=UPI0012DEE34E|nr:hypothetical protein [Marinobacterium lacunae]
MNTNTVLVAFYESLNRDSSAPDNGVEDRQAFLDVARDELRSMVIEPIVVTAFSSEWARNYGEFEKESYEMIAVAAKGNSWLLYEPTSQMFSLARRNSVGKLILIGFRSDDALAEWLG